MNLFDNSSLIRGLILYDSYLQYFDVFLQLSYASFLTCGSNIRGERRYYRRSEKCSSEILLVKPGVL